eukprot:1033875-Rhodomonas_salina.8
MVCGHGYPYCHMACGALVLHLGIRDPCWHSVWHSLCCYICVPARFARFPYCHSVCPRACYATSGTGTAYRAICLCACYAMSGGEVPVLVEGSHNSTDEACGATRALTWKAEEVSAMGLREEDFWYGPTRVLRDVRAELGYAATGSLAMSSTDTGYAATLAMRCPAQQCRAAPPSLRLSLLYDAPILLRSRYAMSGTDLPHAACYAHATRCPVLRGRMLLWARYNIYGTEMGYAATRPTRRAYTTARVAAQGAGERNAEPYAMSVPDIA